MRAPGGIKPGATADLIVEHPAVRRLLDTPRVWIDAGRVLSYRTAIELDLAQRHPDLARCASAQCWCWCARCWRAPLAWQTRVLLEFGVWLGVIQAQCRASARLRGYKIVWGQ